MDFIYLTNPEYKRILRRLVWRTPYIRIWTRWYTLPMLMIMWFIFADLAYNDPEIRGMFVRLGVFSDIYSGEGHAIYPAALAGFLVLMVITLILHLFF